MVSVAAGLGLESVAGPFVMTPTILIFLKAPVQGRVKTRLAVGIGEEAALRAYRRLVERQMAALPEGWPVEVHYAPAGAETMMRDWLGNRPRYVAQPEGDLGHRLRSATEGAFAGGAEAVCLIGGDCPKLGVEHFEQAAATLEEVDAVMGPTIDGGYYLLAMRGPHLALLDHNVWSTPTVAQMSQVIALREDLNLRELEMLRDVDTAADWAALEPLLP